MFVERWTAMQPSLQDKNTWKVREKKYYIIYIMSKNMNAENKDLMMLLVAMVVVLGLVMFMNCGSQNYEPYSGPIGTIPTIVPKSVILGWAHHHPFLRNRTYAEKKAAYLKYQKTVTLAKENRRKQNSDPGRRYASWRKPSTNNNNPGSGYFRTNPSGNYFF